MAAKRKVSRPSTTQAANRRRSQRVSSSGQKSTYFEHDNEDQDEEDALLRSGKREKLRMTKGNEDFDFESARSEMDDSTKSETNEDEEEVDSEDDVLTSHKKGRQPASATAKRSRKQKGARMKGQAAAPDEEAKPVTSAVSRRKRSRTSGESPGKITKKLKASGKSGKGSNASRGDNKADEDNTESDNEEGDEEERVRFIPLPKLKDIRGIEYEDHRVHPNTLEFLGELKQNNHRPWLKMRDPEYRRSLKDWDTFVETLTDKVIEVDDTIPELPLKDVIFRIYRDIRFSKDPTPYKPHYSAAWSRTGRKGPYACYYLHAEPGHCSIGGGIWQPDRHALAKLRASIDERPHRIRRVLMDPQFRHTFLPKAKDGNEKSAVAAFVAMNKENALKKNPQGFHPDHRDIELLKLRNFIVFHKLRDEDLTAKDSQDRIMAIIRPMVQYVTFLNRVVMPDPNFDDDSSDGEDAEDEDGDNAAMGEDSDDEEADGSNE